MDCLFEPEMGGTAKGEVQRVKMVRYMVICSPIEMVMDPALLNLTMHMNATKLSTT